MDVGNQLLEKIPCNITCERDHILLHQRRWRAQFYFMKVYLHLGYFELHYV